MKTCDYCTHVEMCGWHKEVEEQGCEFFSDGMVWIPVSERLPENNGCMLVTIDDAIEFGKYEDGEWSIWVCEHWDEWDAKGVIAWMPLPEPYNCGAKMGGEDGEA